MLWKYWGLSLLKGLFAACVLLMWGVTASQDGGSVTMHRHFPHIIRKSFVKNTQDLLMWEVTAYAAAHGNVRYYSQRPTSSFAEPSRLRGMDMLQGSMCSAHVGGATASQFHHK